MKANSRASTGAFVIACTLALCDAASSATITVQSQRAGAPPLILIEGEIEQRDGDLFQSKTSFLPKAVVSFRSDGGNVVAGLQIGEAIRLKGYATIVSNNARCASACALAWLGGARRQMSNESRIGFHAAYNKSSGQETAVGNALVGAYLNRIGLGYAAVIYITQATPSSMTWLDAGAAEKLGIDVELIESDRAPAARPSIAGPKKANSPAADAPADFDRTTRFAIVRNGFQIGTHTTELHGRGSELRIRQSTQIEVKVIVVVYHFEQSVEELWVGNQLLSLDSSVDDNGTRHRLELRMKDNALLVNGDSKIRQVNAAMMPATLWNSRILRQSSVLSVRDGTEMHIVVSNLGNEEVNVQGHSIRAQHYEIRGPFTQHAWYDDRGNLVQALFVGTDGSDIYWKMM
jgi:Family of unknown function (DUF6134)